MTKLLSLSRCVFTSLISACLLVLLLPSQLLLRVNKLCSIPYENSTHSPEKASFTHSFFHLSHLLISSGASTPTENLQPHHHEHHNPTHPVQQPSTPCSNSAVSLIFFSLPLLLLRFLIATTIITTAINKTRSPIKPAQKTGSWVASCIF